MKTLRDPVFTTLFMALGSLFVTHAQERSPAPQRNKLQLSVECWKQNGWRPVDTHTVFKQQDRICFRLRTSLSGYLYILNQSSSGQAVWLYPPAGNVSNRVESGHEVRIPAGDGSYSIGGPPGFDTLYWILRGTQFAVGEVHAEQLDVPSTLVSRCPEETQKEIACMDKNAGPKQVTDPKKLQAALGLPNSLVARDLTFESKPQSTEIGTDSDGLSSGIIYEVRIAHN